jgi:hypothetical protein
LVSSATDSASAGEGARDGTREGGDGARDGGAGGLGRRDGGAGATAGGTGLNLPTSADRLRLGAGGGPLGRARGGGGALRGLESVSAVGAREGDGGWDGGTDARPDGRGGDGFLGELSSSAMTSMELTP